VVNLQGLTIRNGYITGTGSDVSGAGLYCVNGASFSMTNVVLENNIAQGSSGNINTVAGGGAASTDVRLLFKMSRSMVIKPWG